MSNTATISNSGGAANHTGVRYQDRVAAWLCVQVLAEQEATPLWSWPATTALEFIHCNTVQPTDDVLAGTSHQGLAYINVKHTVNASQSEDSDFAAALTQFVQQFFTSASQPHGAQPWERPLNTQLDRFVLATSMRSSTPVTTVLPVVLQRIRTLLPGQGVNDATRGQAENEILSKALTHLRRAWQTHAGVAPTDAQLSALLSLIYIQVLDVDENGAQEREAKNLLRSSVLLQPTQADVAWHTLIQICNQWAAQRYGGARKDLQQTLLQAGIAVRAPRSYRDDVAYLQEHPEQIYALPRKFSLIETDGEEFKVARAVSPALCIAAEAHSTVIARHEPDMRAGLQPSIQSLPMVQVFRADYAASPEEALRFRRQALSVLPENLRPPIVHDFVGRAAVMQELETLAEQGRLLIVTGITGVGKSALLAQMAARKSPANVFWYTCYPKLASLDDLLIRLSGFLPSSDANPAETVPERAATLLERLNQSACWLFIDDAHLVAEDAEWHGFFKLLKDHLRSGAAFLACCTKPDFLTPLDEASQKAHVFHLGGLPTEDVNEFLRANGLALTLPTAQEITDKLGGQPMALRLLATLAEADASERALLVHAEKAREQTVDYLSQQVFYSSATAEQDLLSVAALFAFPFTRSQLTEIYQRFTRQNGNQAFLQLRRRALLREFADGYLELPPLLQAVAQAHVTGDSKERYRSAAAFLAESEPEEVLPLLNALYLYRKAQEFDEAATVALDLIGGSLLPYSPTLAQQILMAFKQEEVSPEHWLWLLGERGVVVGHLRQYEEETRCYREMLRLAKAQGNQEAQALAYQRLGISSFYSDTQIAEAFYLQSLALYEELSNLRGQSQIHNNLALLYEKLGEVSRAQAALEKALQLHQQLNSAPWEYLAVYSNLGVFAARQEQWERAYHFSEEAEKIARECEAPHEIARAIFNLGRHDMTLAKTDSMCERFDEALAVADKYQLKDIEELVCSSYARFHYDAGRPKESLAYLQRVANVQEALQDKRKLAGTYVELATAYWRNHETEQSFQFIRRSLALFEYLKESDGLEQLLSNITAICLDLKNDDETERVYLALKLLRRRLRGRQPSYLLARVCRALGQFRISNGQYDQLAHHYFRTEINLLAALERTSEQLQSMMNVGQIHQQFGSLPQAVLINQEAIVLAAQTGERKTQACLQYNLANCFTEAEEFAAAESAYCVAHGIALELNQKDLQHKIEHNLGETLRRAEKFTEAVEWLNAGYSHAKELDDPEGQIQALNNLGLAYEKLKDSAKALDHFERALALCKERGFQREEANVLISLGNFYYRDEPAKARDYYQQSLRTARAAEDAEMEEKAMVSLIYVCRKLGIADEIQADLQTAVDHALQSHNYDHLIEYCTLAGEINLDEDGFESAAEMFEKAFLFALMADVQRRQRMLANEDESETVQMVFQLIATLNELVVKDKLAIARKFYDALMGNLSRMPQLEPSNPLLKTLSIIGNFFDADTKLSLEDYVMGQFNTVDSDGA